MQLTSLPDARYLDPEHIVISAKASVAPTAEEVEWGRRFLGSLHAPEHGGPSARACAIQRETSRTLKYLIPSPRTVSQIVARRGGNCVSHAIMGTFLLRLAGIPARMCYEFHIRDHFPVHGWRAARQRTGGFSADHNSHVWVMFHDGRLWQPYDSALGLTNWEEFFAIRTRTQRWPYTLSFDPQRMTGPPFIVELETGASRTGKVNITSEIWGRDFAWGNSKVSRDEWLEFVRGFEGRGTGDFRFPLDRETRAKLRAMSARWF